MADDQERDLERIKPDYADVLDAIRAFKNEYGSAPTYRELASAIGCSRMTAHRTVLEMRQDGLLKIIPWRSRSIVIIEENRGKN